MPYEQFCASSSSHFDEISDMFDFPEEQPNVVAAPAVVFPPPAVIQPAPQSAAEKDLSRICSEISFFELQNAALIMGKQNTAFDLNWECNLLGQFQNGIHALQSQNVDTSCMFALSNMLEQIRSEQKTIRTGVYYSLLHLVDKKEREEQEKKKKAQTAQSRANSRKAVKRPAAAALPESTEVTDLLRKLQPLPLVQQQQHSQQLYLVQPQLQPPEQEPDFAVRPGKQRRPEQEKQERKERKQAKEKRKHSKENFDY